MHIKNMDVEEGGLGGEKCICVWVFFFFFFWGGGGGVKYDTSLFKKKSVGLYTISVNSLQLSH